MTHIYNISGMSCNGCKAEVVNAPSLLPNIERVSVDLEAKDATIKMTSYLNVESLQKVLSSRHKTINKVSAHIFSVNKTQTILL